jgi:hypothetical protein
MATYHLSIACEAARQLGTVAGHRAAPAAHYSPPRIERIGVPKQWRRSESNALIRRRIGQCMDHILAS